MWNAAKRLNDYELNLGPDFGKTSIDANNLDVRIQCANPLLELEHILLVDKLFGDIVPFESLDPSIGSAISMMHEYDLFAAMLPDCDFEGLPSRPAILQEPL